MKLNTDIEAMVDQLLGPVWPGGHRQPPILDDRAYADFAWVAGRAVPLPREEPVKAPEDKL